MDENKIIEEEIETKEKKKEFNLLKEIFEWVYTIVIALVVAFLIKGFLFDIVEVDGSSMYPTLVDGDRLIVAKLLYEPKTEDIVILDASYKNRMAYYEELAKEDGKDVNFWFELVNYGKIPDDLKKVYYVKRVIATEGQTVDLVDGKVIVDGEVLDEEYYDGITNKTSNSIQFPLTVEKDHVFVMGDNRSASLDSRNQSVGQVPEEAVSGKSLFRIWPVTDWGITK